jgi:hypothetical protein
MTKLLVIIFILFAVSAQAASLKSSSEITIDPRGNVYAYSFGINGSSDLAVAIYSCWKTTRGERLRVAATEWDCAEDKTSADAMAQKKADVFEHNLATKGFGG